MEDLAYTEAAHAIEVGLPESLGNEHSAIAGDRNPIHQYAGLARSFGFPQGITHGMWNLARAPFSGLTVATRLQ